MIIEGHAVNAMQIEALDQNLLEFTDRQQKFKSSQHSPVRKEANDVELNKNLEKTIEKFKAYKQSLVHANNNERRVLDTK